jgi:hypothetical protein
MARFPRLLVTDVPTVYHIISRTALDGLPFNTVDKDDFVTRLKSLAQVYFTEILGYCVMDKAVLIPELRLTWTHEFLSEQEDLTFEFITAGPSFDTPGRDIPRDAAVIGLAVKAPSRTLSLPLLTKNAV